MPFEKIYEVNFSNFNLQPHINPLYWPAMRLDPPFDYDMAARYADPAGISLQIKRYPDIPEAVMNNIYLVPPSGIRMDTRLLIQVEFDLPEAVGFPTYASEVGQIKHSKEYGDTALFGEVRHSPPHRSNYTVPEPWALALNISPRADLRYPQLAAKVSCQFHRKFNGVRLNTPGALQKDQAAILEQPLDYSRYQGTAIQQPDRLYPRPFGNKPILPGPPPTFLLQHSFCGWPASYSNVCVQAAGCGFLELYRGGQIWAKDHRVYSIRPLGWSSPNISTDIFGGPKIRALGISLATFEGYGWMSVRVRSFSLWLNHSIGGNPIFDDNLLYY